MVLPYDSLRSARKKCISTPCPALEKLPRNAPSSRPGQLAKGPLMANSGRSQTRADRSASLPKLDATGCSRTCPEKPLLRHSAQPGGTPKGRSEPLNECAGGGKCKALNAFSSPYRKRGLLSWRYDRTILRSRKTFFICIRRERDGIL